MNTQIRDGIRTEADRPAPLDFKTEMAVKYPAMVAKAKSSRLVAVRLFCVECMGGSRNDAKGCETTGCFLWPHRGSSWKPAP
jgi:hypothetical protein